jgi:hypothetical protein
MNQTREGTTIAGYTYWLSPTEKDTRRDNAANVTLDTLRKVFGAMQTVVKIQLVPRA